MKRGCYLTLWLFLSEYLFLILCSTIIYRDVSDTHVIHFNPFWSYYNNVSNTFSILPEHIMNVLMFVPVGVSFALLLKKHVIIKAVIVGMFFSCFVESLQFVLYRGTSEIDDVLNNTFGCVIGAFIVYLCILWHGILRTKELWIS